MAYCVTNQTKTPEFGDMSATDGVSFSFVVEQHSDTLVYARLESSSDRTERED